MPMMLCPLFHHFNKIKRYAFRFTAEQKNKTAAKNFSKSVEFAAEQPRASSLFRNRLADVENMDAESGINYKE